MTDDSKEVNVGGAPPLYATPELLQEAIDKYIATPPTRIAKTKDGEFEIPIITISRLCYELGFSSRQSFYDYEKRAGFSYTIKRARLFIESEYEGNLTSPACTGSIFALKNMGWDDKQLTELSGKGGQPIEWSILPVIPNKTNEKDT
jgi:hypothetical protein